MTTLFITRPVTTVLVTFGIIFFGIVAYRDLPVSEMPNIDFPTIQVTATLPGADPETMAAAVATPLEKQFSTIAGVDSMTSVSSLGRSQITVQFALDRMIDAAALDVQSGIAAAQGLLPTGMPTPPVFSKVNPADSPIFYIRCTSKSLPIYTVTDYAKTFISQRISMLPGVAQTLIFGEQTYAPRIQVNPDRLAAYGLGLDEVADAVIAANVNLPTGVLDGEVKAYSVKSDGQLMRAADYNRQIVAWRKGAPIRIDDIGQAVDASQNSRYGAFFGQEQSITIAVKRQPGANTIAVVDAIKDLLPKIRTALPQAIELNIAYDRSISIRDSVEDVKFTLLLSVGLTVVVVFLFLRSLTATIIAALALPASIIGTFAVMKLMNYSLDNMSLMALTLAVGFIVDDAIVMLENIVRHMEEGKTPFQAALDGAKQIGFTIVSMTLSLAVVFTPILFMAGIIGRILNELAAVITIAVMVSGFVTLSFTPMLCSRWLKTGLKIEHSGGLFSKIEALYEKSLHLCMRFHPVVFASSIALMFIAGWLFTKVPAGFIPSSDSGLIYGFARAEQSASFQVMRERMLRVNEIVKSDPDVNNVIALVGVGGPNTVVNQSGFFTFPKPLHDRPGVTADDIVNRLRKKLAGQPDLRVFMFNPPAIQIGGRQSTALYMFTLMSPDTKELYDSARRFEGLMRGLPGLTDVVSDLQLEGPQINIKIDRDRAAQVGATPKIIQTALQSAYSERQIGNIYAPTDTYKVIVEVDPAYQTDPRLLDKIFVRADMEKNLDRIKDALIPLSSVAKVSRGVGPTVVNHTGQLTSATISFNLAPGYALSQAAKAIEALAKKELPPTVSHIFEGQADAFKKSFSSVPFLLFLAVLVIYMILGVLYESFLHPLTILSGLPSAAVGGILMLLFFQKPLDIYGFVGIVMLIGIVKKNAIMVVDFAVEAEKSGMSARDAAVKGAVVRFRPIMMTTAAAVAGILPIALAVGETGPVRQPMGLVVAGGLILSQVVTLYLTPVFYMYMDRLQSFLKRSKG